MTSKDIQLTKLLRMLGSDQDGEVVNAARLIGRILNNLGIGWVDAFSPTNLSPAVMIAELRQLGGHTVWVTKFLTDLAQKVRDRALSPKQYAIVRRLYRKTFGV